MISKTRSKTLWNSQQVVFAVSIHSQNCLEYREQNNRCAFPREDNHSAPLMFPLCSLSLLQAQNRYCKRFIVIGHGDRLALKFPINNMYFQWFSLNCSLIIFLWGNQITHRIWGCVVFDVLIRVIHATKMKILKFEYVGQLLSSLQQKGYITTNYNAKWLLKLKEKKTPNQISR